jgi:3-deoxy-D-manno-octulosonate 8-phosphate phosphatase (KDO 8-P phosphatase)
VIDPGLARRIRLVGLDVDGVMTDGGVYIGAVDRQPLEFKRYDIQDGIGIHLLQQSGIRVAIVTGRVSDSVRLRAADLGVDDLVQNANALKLPGLREILGKHRIDPSEVAFVSDDLADIPVLRIVGLPVAVANAVPEVRRECSVQLEREGGRGAIREFTEKLLKSRGQWESAWRQYVDERSSAGDPRQASS